MRQPQKATMKFCKCLFAKTLCPCWSRWYIEDEEQNYREMCPDGAPPHDHEAETHNEEEDDNEDHVGLTKWLRHVAKEMLSRHRSSRDVTRSPRAPPIGSPESWKNIDYIDVLSALTDRLLDEENSSGFERTVASLRLLFRRNVSNDLEQIFQYAPRILQVGRS